MTTVTLPKHINYPIKNESSTLYNKGLRAWLTPFFEESICRLAVYKFTNASDYFHTQAQALLLSEQLANASWVGANDTAGHDVWRRSRYLVQTDGTREGQPTTKEVWTNISFHFDLRSGALRQI
eukprot:COSAG01_NODE_16902_length_1195_cov_1.194343_2_plen_123_part_01